MITLDSFVPILENLPGSFLDENAYVSHVLIYYLGKYIAHFL